MFDCWLMCFATYSWQEKAFAITWCRVTTKRLSTPVTAHLWARPRSMRKRVDDVGWRQSKRRPVSVQGVCSYLTLPAAHQNPARAWLRKGKEKNWTETLPPPKTSVQTVCSIRRPVPTAPLLKRCLISILMRICLFAFCAFWGWRASVRILTGPIKAAGHVMMRRGCHRESSLKTNSASLTARARSGLGG